MAYGLKASSCAPLIVDQVFNIGPILLYSEQHLLKRPRFKFKTLHRIHTIYIRNTLYIHIVIYKEAKKQCLCKDERKPALNSRLRAPSPP